jgi:DNA-directed RNA polymerase subunit K/omega
MIKTLPLEELDKYADTIYEAIIMIAKRANEINQHQKKMLDDASEAAAMDNLDIDDESINTDWVDRQYLKLPKPSTIALEEMLSGKLTREFPESK